MDIYRSGGPDLFSTVAKSNYVMPQLNPNEVAWLVMALLAFTALAIFLFRVDRTKRGWIRDLHRDAVETDSSAAKPVDPVLAAKRAQARRERRVKRQARESARANRRR